MTPLQQDQQRQQQQVLLQALAQQQQQQQQQQQHQQQNLAVAQAAASQMASVQAALQQTELENRLLKQSIERENLKKQLQQVQANTTSPPASAGFAPALFGAQAGSPDDSYSSGIVMPPGVLPSPREVQMSQSSAERMVASSSREGPATAPKRVQFIKSNFESQPGPSHAGYDQSSLAQGVARSTRTVTFTTTSTVQSQGGSAAATSLFGQQGRSSPPPPPLPSQPPPAAPDENADIYTDGFSVTPSLHTQPKAPLPPPPAPPPPPMSTTPSGLQIDKEKGTFTVRDVHGRSRTIRIGKVSGSIFKTQPVPLLPPSTPPFLGGWGWRGGGLNKPNNKIICLFVSVILPIGHLLQSVMTKGWLLFFFFFCT